MEIPNNIIEDMHAYSELMSDAINIATHVASDADQFAEENALMLGIEKSMCGTIYSLAVAHVIKRLRDEKNKREADVEMSTHNHANHAAGEITSVVYNANTTVNNGEEKQPALFMLTIFIDSSDYAAVRFPDTLYMKIDKIISCIDYEFKLEKAYLVYGSIDANDAIEITSISEAAGLDEFTLPKGSYQRIFRFENNKICPMLKPIDKRTGNYSRFIEPVREIANAIHETAIKHGWWEDEIVYENKRNDGECIALMHSELSEALEALRHTGQFRTADGTPIQVGSDHIPEFLAIEEEYADVIIRILDHAHRRGWDVAGALAAKMEFNDNRPYKHGGKAF